MNGIWNREYQILSLKRDLDKPIVDFVILILRWVLYIFIITSLRLLVLLIFLGIFVSRSLRVWYFWFVGWSYYCTDVGKNNFLLFFYSIKVNFLFIRRWDPWILIDFLSILFIRHVQIVPVGYEFEINVLVKIQWFWDVISSGCWC